MIKTIKANYWVWQFSLLGASITSFGLGLLLADYFSPSWAWLIVIIGALMHGPAMYNMYKRPRT